MNQRPENYRDIFTLRGAAQDEAMTICPNALEEEFACLVELADISVGTRVLDLGAAGGHLRQAVEARGARYSCVDCCEVLVERALSRGLDAHHAPLQSLPFANGRFQVCIAQAALHHESSLDAIFREARRVTAPGGSIVIGEVAEGSPAAGFLDVFVDRHNPLGHRGNYANDAFVAALREAGWHIVADDFREFEWRFSSRGDLQTFLSGFFYMPELDEATLSAGIDHHLGRLRETREGICMPWGLRVVAARNPFAS